MIYFEIKEKTSNKLVASNLDQCSESVIDLFAGKELENVTIDNVRNVVRSNDEYEVRLLLVDDDELNAGKKGVSRIANVLLSLIPAFQKMERRHKQRSETIMGRFIHNLVDLDKKLKGHLQQLAPDNVRDREFDRFVEEVEQRIKSNPRDAALAICRISHRATDLEAQIAGLRVIAEKTGPSLVDVKLQRTLHRLMQLSLTELTKKNIKVNNQIDASVESRHRVRIDPQLLNVALSQFFANAAKYTCEGTELTITASFSDRMCDISVQMVSRKIEPHEIDKIFDELYKGEHARDEDGSGIGLFITKKALKIMKGDIQVEPQEGTDINVGAKKYAVNIFKISLPCKKLNGD